MRVSNENLLETAVASELVSDVGSAGLDSFSYVNGCVLGRIEENIPPLRGDERLRQLLEASVTANVETILHVMQNNLNLQGVGAPLAAVEYARRLAQRGVPVVELVRAYRLGQAAFCEWALHDVRQKATEAKVLGESAQRISDVTFNYIDEVTNQVVSVYERERDAWLQNQSHIRAARTRALLSEETNDVDTAELALGFRLRQPQLAMIAWIETETPTGDELGQVESLVRSLGEALPCPNAPLFVPADEVSGWAWLPLGNDGGYDRSIFESLVTKFDSRMRVALGKCGSGLQGFRHTFRQACQVQLVSTTAGSVAAQIMTFDDVAPVALMCSDLDSARAWVVDTLGPLAVIGAQNEILRETLRVFLATGGSYTTTASQLTLHKNSVQYRVRKAERILGYEISEWRVDLELALLACRWLGSAVLQRNVDQLM